MDDLRASLLSFAVIFVVTQLTAFLIDFIAWTVRRRHPASIEKSEDVKYPQYLTVSVWHDSHYFHGYRKITFIRKEDNKYKKYVKRSVGGWIAKILIDLVWLLIIFAFPIAGLIYAPNFPHPDVLFGCSALIAFMLLHVYLAGPDSLARMELNKYLKAQRE